MAMVCAYITGSPPFHAVLLHPLVRDRHGMKMSKSVGNVIDPEDVRTGVSLESMLVGVSHLLRHAAASLLTFAVSFVSKTYPSMCRPLSTKEL